MDGPPTLGDPPDTPNTLKVAAGGPVGIGTSPPWPTYADLAGRLLDNGYEPVPIHPRSKAVAAKGWTEGVIDAARVDTWCRDFGNCGIGLRTGRLVGLDIDVLDADVAHRLAAGATEMFGPTLIRVGLWPKRLLLYRNDAPIRKLNLPCLDILGVGQQFVAFGTHPGTGRPYDWVTGETPCEVPVDQLPSVDEAGLQRFLGEAAALTAHLADERRPRRDRPAGMVLASGPTRNADGIVTDGRDAWLSTIAFHAVHDAVDAGETPDPRRLAALVWDRFVATTDLNRPQKDGRRPWSPGDAARKVGDKLGLLAHGRLPARASEDAQPEVLGELLPVPEARARLGEAIAASLLAAETWWGGDRSTAAPVAGIRATVGLGKSAVSRAQIVDWQRRMQQAGLPHRVLVVTPSHALAEEAAADWAAKVDGRVAVLRGYEAKDPVTREPMCRDLEMVNLALKERLSVGQAACYTSTTWRCAHFEGCLKQQNKREVAAADVVLAPYDVLFTGPVAGSEPIGLIVIDEGCWQRAGDDVKGPSVEQFSSVGLSSGLQPDDPGAAAAMADLGALRAKGQRAFMQNGPGRVEIASLVGAGLTAEDCRLAAELEERCIRDPEIYPGMKLHLRKAAMGIIRRNETARRLAAIWRACAATMDGEDAGKHLLRVTPPKDKTGEHGLILHGHKRLAASLSGIPILHLDATLRPELARCILPGLQVTRIEAEQPHMHLTLVAGRFGKTTICPAPDLPPDERQRRQNRLREIVDHVRWEARRVAPSMVLVVTNMEIEAAFSRISGVQTAHFNAIAGLDQYRDVRLLIVVGRPLPSSEALIPPTASFFRTLPDGDYRPTTRSVQLRSGEVARLRAIAHEDPKAELLRAAICDDEIIQAIGRGRGVNRKADNPLEVQLLADVALPLIHDRVLAWETLEPDVVQRMLLAGVAVDSPADAAALHPGLFQTSNQAKMVFHRTAFGCQNPIDDSYREMTLKSARYRRSGRGRSWQTCWWIDGEAADVRQRLEGALGALAGWEAV